MVLNPTLSHLPEIYARFPRISIVGVGDEGNSIVSQIFEDGASGAQCIAVNTDSTSLDRIYCHEKVLINPQTTRDEEATSDQVIKEGVVQECVGLMTPLLANADVAFIIVGGGEIRELSTATATASVARQSGATTVSVAIMSPTLQMNDGLAASHQLARMRQNSHTLAIVDSRFLTQKPEYTSGLFADSADQLVTDIVSGFSQVLACPSTVNIELPAFRELMAHGRIAHVGIAQSASALRVEEATMGALAGPLSYDDIGRCHGALVMVRGDSSLTIDEAERAAEVIAERAGWNVPVVMGARFDESWYEGCQVSILLTGGAYPHIPGGYRRLPLDMYEMEPNGEEKGPIGLELDLDQLEDQ